MSDKNHARKDDIRRYAAQHGVSYTTAMRALDGTPPGLPTVANNPWPDPHEYDDATDSVYVAVLWEDVSLEWDTDTGWRSYTTLADALTEYENRKAANPKYLVQLWAIRVPLEQLTDNMVMTRSEKERMYINTSQQGTEWAGWLPLAWRSGIKDASEYAEYYPSAEPLMKQLRNPASKQQTLDAFELSARNTWPDGNPGTAAPHRP